MVHCVVMLLTVNRSNLINITSLA